MPSYFLPCVYAQSDYNAISETHICLHQCYFELAMINITNDNRVRRTGSGQSADVRWRTGARRPLYSRIPLSIYPHYSGDRPACLSLSGSRTATSTILVFFTSLSRLSGLSFINDFIQLYLKQLDALCINISVTISLKRWTQETVIHSVFTITEVHRK